MTLRTLRPAPLTLTAVCWSRNTQIDANEGMRTVQGHTETHSMYTELVQTPTKGLALTVGPLCPMMSCYFKLPASIFCSGIRPHESSKTHFQTRLMKVATVCGLQKQK